MGLFSLKHSQTLHIILARFLVVVNRLQPIQPLGRLNHELHLSFVPGLAGGKKKKEEEKEEEKKRRRKKKKKKEFMKRVRLDLTNLFYQSCHWAPKNSPKNSRTPSHDLPTKK